MKPVKDVICTVVDNGNFVDIACKLSQTFKKVYYCTNWKSACPKMNIGRIGEGMEGLETVDSPFTKFEETDLYCFFDVYDGDVQVHLESLGKAVWGSRMGEELEIYRDSAKEAMKSHGLPVGKYEAVHGIDELRKHLMKHESQWIKINKYRGQFESFFSENYKLIEPQLDKLEHDLGPAFKNATDFIVEEDLPDREEFGIDAYCVDGKFPSRLLHGLEVKDCGYVGKMADLKSIPEPITRPTTKMASVLKEYGYRGPISTEVRIGKDKTPYLVDWTNRQPSPPSELYCEMYKNFAEIVWSTANGKLIDPVPAAQYGAEIKIISHWAEHEQQPIYFPKENRQWIKLRNCVKTKDQYYVIPQESVEKDVGAVIGLGSTMDEAIKKAKAIAETVEGHGIKCNSDALDEAKERIANMNKIFPGMM